MTATLREAQTVTDLVEIIARGALARAGLLSGQDIENAAALAAQVANSDLETLRVLFTDQHGILRGKTIVASAFPSIFTSGIAVTSTLLLKDTSHRTVFPIWSADSGIKAGPMQGASDILLVPDPATFRTLPWSPHSALILCDTAFKSGAPISFASRSVLKTALPKLAAKNIEMVVGLEVEFHVYERLDPKLAHAQATMPGQAPETRNLAQGYQFLTETRYGELEDVMDELRRCCQAMKLPVRSMEVEMGPSQFEFTFDPASPLEHADNMVIFRTMVKEVCARRGLHATFMCRPKIENGAASGWHLHQSLVDARTGENLMMPDAEGALTPRAGQWIAGLLEHAAASCLLTTPTVNGYKRYQPFQLAPDRIQWGRDNRGAMIRGLMNPGDTASRVENRVAETTANPYYFFASQILSGLDGIARNLQAPAAVETPYDSDAQSLPKSLVAAIERFEESALYRSELGDEFVDYLVHIKRAEWDRYLMTVSEWEQNEYFSLY
jgi:glutamine synthetase